MHAFLVPDPAVEFELKFLVPRRARAALRAALRARGAKPETQRLVARYFDTGDRRLARAGMSLRLRREGRRWVQTLKAGGEAALARFEHEAARPDDTLDVAVHAGTPAGERLAALLADGEPLVPRYGTDIRRVVRRLRARGATVELAFDEGRIEAQGRRWPVCELEFELLSGSHATLFALAERWRARFGLVIDSRSKAARGDALADGRPMRAPRRAMPVGLAPEACVDEAWRAVLDECIAQVLANAIGLAAAVGVEATVGVGAASTRTAAGSHDVDRAEQVHQLRIGLRRLRVALRLFRGWMSPAPDEIGDGARELHRALGVARDLDVLEQVVEPALQRAGAPGMPAPQRSGPTATVPCDPAALVAGDAAQRWLLSLLAWRDGLDVAIAGNRDAEPPAPTALAAPARRRLARWLRSIDADARRFAQLDDAARHALRRRAKRLRYASEFVELLFAGRRMRRLLARLRVALRVLGEWNDLSMAARRYRGGPQADARDWFAAGWIAARRDALATQAADALARLAKRHPFGKR
ncbi:MAG: CYTH domain-containing protein [Burkholderiaceae bacterium]|nr:CYTH domain-containing protein [Burkholderiaceae bacterium]